MTEHHPPPSSGQERCTVKSNAKQALPLIPRGPRVDRREKRTPDAQPRNKPCRPSLLQNRTTQTSLSPGAGAVTPVKEAAAHLPSQAGGAGPWVSADSALGCIPRSENPPEPPTSSGTESRAPGPRGHQEQPHGHQGTGRDTADRQRTGAVQSRALRPGRVETRARHAESAR